VKKQKHGRKSGNSHTLDKYIGGGWGKPNGENKPGERCYRKRPIVMEDWKVKDGRERETLVSIGGHKDGASMQKSD